MKTRTCFSIGFFLLGAMTAWAQPQQNDLAMADTGMGREESVIVSYKVEERVNLRFGAHMTTYEVSDISLVNTNDLGPENSRTVTPRYGKVRLKTDRVAFDGLSLSTVLLMPAPSMEVKIPIHTNVYVEKKTRIAPDFVLISKTDTYERILEKGYESIDMMKRVANSRYFEGNMVSAAKWFDKLYALVPNLEEPEYFRYAEALKATGNASKAKQMMAKYEAAAAASKH